MSSSGERTEEATPQKLRKAREKGQVAMSRDLSAAAVFIAALVLLIGQLAAVTQSLEALTRTSIAAATDPDLSVDVVLRVAGGVFAQGMASIAPLVIGIFIVAVLATFLQVGPLLTLEPLMPKLEKLNPIEGLRNLFLKPSPYVELLKAILKITVLGTLCYLVLHDSIERVLRLSGEPIEGIAATSRDLVVTLAKRAALFFVVVGVIDFFYQRWHFLKDQRMTKEEVKREFKDQEGDPQHKAARHRLHEEISQDTMLQDVREADVIVVNPTHVACALRYDPKHEGAPRLVGKGKGNLAERIRAIAKENDIPILRDVSLARTLYELKVDTQIPEELYEAVAEVLRWVETVAESRGQKAKWIETEQPPGDGGPEKPRQR
jgi:flagellar biosynthesis protein FlhB